MQAVWMVPAVMLTVGCGGERTVAPAPRPGVHFQQAGPVSGAIFAAPRSLVVTVRAAAGAPKGGVLVRFEAHRPRISFDRLPYPFVAERLGVSLSPNALNFDSTVVATTDLSGAATVWFQLGTKAGNGAIVARSTSDGSVDSVVTTTLPGPTVGIVYAPDTSMILGHTLALRAQPADAMLNPTGGSVSLSVLSGPLTVTSTGLITASAYGRGYVRISGAGTSRVAGITVVPDGTLAVVAWGGLGDSAGVYVVRTDGSEGRWVHRLRNFNSAFYTTGLWPTWSPVGGSIAFVDSVGLRIVDQNGANPRDLLTTTPLPSQSDGLQFSADGQWIYFTRGTQYEPGGSWRIHPDGTGLTRISPLDSPTDGLSLTPSPDGARVAFTSSTAPVGIRVMPSAGGAATLIHTGGTSPRWSPSQDRIGILTDGDDADGHSIDIVSSAGTVIQSYASAAVGFGFGWSPDGAWVVSVFQGFADPQVPSTNGYRFGLQFLNAATGQRLQSVWWGPEGAFAMQPSWRPMP